MWDVTLNMWGESIGPLPRSLLQNGAEIRATYDFTGSIQGTPESLDTE